MRLLARVLPSVLALGAVAAVVLLLIGIFGRAPAGVSAGQTPPTTTTSVPPSTPATAATTPSPASPVASAPVSPAPTPTPTTGAVGEPSSTTTAPDDLPELDVVVLNSTSETGLAGRVSDYLAGLGWPTGEPGNFEAAVELTTVYFPEGYEEAARSVAAVAPGSGTSVAPVTPDVGSDVLTVVLGADAVGWAPPTPGPTPT